MNKKVERRSGGWWLAIWAALMVGVPLVRFIVAPAEAVVWTAAAYETTPAAGAAVSEGDDRMREMKEQNRFRLEAEHFLGDDLDDDNGLHRLGSARAYMTTAAPDELNDSHSGQASGTLTDYLNTGVEDGGEEDLNDAASNSAAGAEDDVGHGRFWLDTDGADASDGNADDNQLYIFEGVAGAGNGAWAVIQGQTGGSLGGDDQILAGSRNLVYNGNFAATDGTGAVGATVIPIGYSVIDAATFTYTDPSTDVRWGDGLMVNVLDVDGGDGIQFVLTNLAAATTFKVIVRVSEDNSSDICTLTSTGASTDVTSTASAGTAWATLSGTFVTAATLDTVTILLTNTAAGDICHYSHIGVYQTGDPLTDRDEVTYPGGTIVLFDDNGSTETSFTSGYSAIGGIGTLTVTPPAPNYVVTVVGQVSILTVGAAAGGCPARITENGAAVAHGVNDMTVGADATTTIQYVNINPTPGTALAYILEVDEIANGGHDCQTPTTEDPDSSLMVRMEPAG